MNVDPFVAFVDSLNNEGFVYPVYIETFDKHQAVRNLVPFVVVFVDSVDNEGFVYPVYIETFDKHQAVRKLVRFVVVFVDSVDNEGFVYPVYIETFDKNQAVRKLVRFVHPVDNPLKPPNLYGAKLFQPPLKDSFPFILFPLRVRGSGVRLQALNQHSTIATGGVSDYRCPRSIH